MRPIAGAGRMAAVEEECRSRHGLGDREMMERAAAALEDALREAGDLADAASVCVAAGRGNNGGDGLALASRLARAGKAEVTALRLSGRASAECAFRLAEAEREGVRIIAWPEEEEAARRALEGADLLVDAVAGTGLSSPLRENEARLCALWNGCRGKKVALDLPSGFREGMDEGDPVYAADETLCIGLVKECLLAPAFRKLAGRIRVLERGVFPEEALAALPGQAMELEEPDLRGSLKPFDSDAHKYERGSLSVFAGSRSGLGAARLCAEASLRSGAGIARLMVDADIWTAAASGCGGLIVKSLAREGGLDEEESAEASKASCIVAGPGWGRGEGRKGILRDLLSLGRPLVLDADGLFALPALGSDPPGWPAIITPHPGEASRLLGKPARELERSPAAAARALAESFHCIAVLKGNVAWIADAAGRTAAFDASFPPLACAGSGDVLAGICGGFSARGLEPFEAACAAVLAHCRAGKLAWKDMGYFMAQDLCLRVSRAAAEAEEGACDER